MSIATFESPQAATQQFFPWVLEDESESMVAEAVPVAEVTRIVRPAPAARVTESRSAEPVRLGAVMIKLLKSYGITDAEIAEGMAAYAAKSGLARAS